MRSGRNAGKLKLAQQVVILRQCTLALEDLDEDSRLVISCGGERLTLAHGDDSVAGNEFGEDTTGGLNTERKQADINENDIFRSLLPERVPPCTAAPYATASSGLIPLEGSLPK